MRGSRPVLTSRFAEIMEHTMSKATNNPAIGGVLAVLFALLTQ
jgi:hypothetical protein